MLKLGILLIAIGFLVGCTTSKEDALIRSYKQKVDYHKQLQKTEKIQFFDNDVTKVVLTATYLYTPNFEKFDIRDEKFIVGVHLEDETAVGIKDIIEIFGIRNINEIKKMRAEQKNKSKVVRNSLYDDMMSLVDNNTVKANNKRQKSKKTNKRKSKKNTKKIKKYGLMLQGKKAIEIKELSKNDERLKDIAYVTEWGFYYLVTFEHTNSKRFSLVFNNKKYGKGKFSFAKVAKYIYTKKGF